MTKRALVLILALPLALAACVKGSDSTTPSPNPNSGFQARFSPLGGVMPFPNDLYFSGSTTGTLNIPVSDPTQAANAPIMAMNHLDGFGTQSAINAYFTAAIDKTSLGPTDVMVLKVTTDPATKAINPLAGATPLVYGTDYSVSVSSGTDADGVASGTVLNITPLKPLAAGSSYLVILTNGIKDTSGAAVTPSTDYASILAADAPALAAGDVTKIDATQLTSSALLPVAQFTFPQLAVAVGAGLSPSNIAETFSFTTVDAGESLDAIAAAAKPTAQPAGVGIVDTGMTVAAALTAGGQTPPAVAALAELYAGTVALPYYSPVPTSSAPMAPLTGWWHNSTNGGDTTFVDPMPKATVAQNVIPILVTIPDASSGCGAMPAAGWPTVIFQHGITRNREDMLAIAGTFASQCFAVVAIDLPLHGVTNTADPFYMKGLERTFDLPEVAPFFSANSSTIAPSGSYFINLGSLLTARDNLREGVADLINLTATLPTLAAVNSATAPTVINTFDGSRLYFVGHSLGAIVGTTFLGVDGKKIVAATLANPGGDITQLLLNSQSFAPEINAGLAAQGLLPGTQMYDDYFRDAQSVIDGGAPANFAAAAAANLPIHMLEVVGGYNSDPCNVPDTVVPNSSTDLLVSLMGLTHATSTIAPGPTPIHAVVKFAAGDHGSILNPAPPSTACSADASLYGAVTTEMQTESVSFIASNGYYLPINNNPAGLIK